MKRILCAVALICVGGCESAKDREALLPVVSTPLEHDPTERTELARWWWNGRELLRLDDNAGYALFADGNRYSRPTERGRWTQQHYAALTLEPYNRLHHERKRVSITKIDGKLAIVPPRLAPMYPLQRPPAVIEDRLIGTWTGDLGELELRSDMRYVLRPASSEPDQPLNVRVGQNGRWSVSDNEVVLQSSVPGLDPVRLPMQVGEQRIILETDEGTLMKVEPDSAG